MNRLVFVIAVWVFFGLELGLKDAFRLGESSVAPSFVVCLLVFVAMHTSAVTAVGAGMVIGLLLDITSGRPAPETMELVTVLGPRALGCAAAAYAVHTSRTLVVQQNPLTFGFLAFLAVIVMEAVAAALLEIRSIYDPLVDFHAGAELGGKFGSAVYTAVIALAVGPALRRFTRAFGFPQTGMTRGRVRMR